MVWGVGEPWVLVGRDEVREGVLSISVCQCWHRDSCREGSDLSGVDGSVRRLIESGWGGGEGMRGVWQESE